MPTRPAPETFGDLLRRFRTAAGLTQEELAERSSLSARGISDLERGVKTRPHFETVRLLADALTLSNADRQGLLTAARPALLRHNALGPAPPMPVCLPGAESVMAHPASGTVTWLFADLAETRRLWREHGAALPAASARFVALVRSAAAGHGGTVMTAQATALFFSFPTPPAAVATVLAAQYGLGREAWENVGLPEPLPVRMALHAGNVSPEAQDTTHSPELTYLDRLLAAGHPGQVLVSAVVASMLRDLLAASEEEWPEEIRLPEGVALRDLGTHRYPDHGAEHVFQLLAPGLPDDFPPLGASASRPGQLPAQPNSLVGRTAELAEIHELLLRPELRLLTLTGPGGVGKTRLAFAVAERLETTFTDGVYLVDLAPLTDAALVETRIAQALGVNETAGQPVMERLRRHLEERHLLLVLDNFEHLLEAARLVAELLTACPNLTVLITSRSPLHVRGEQQFLVPPLALPDTDQATTPAAALQSEAVQLFVHRAQAVRPGFGLDEATATDVAGICQRLDGLPLAIELAAARMRLLPPRALLARLERRLPLLTGGARDAPARQQTLRDTIAWSVDLLSPEEQILFRRLSVFAGGCTYEAAEAVGNGAGEPSLDVEAGIEALVDASLLQVSEERRDSRFTMLETVREFALEQLRDAGEERAIRDAQAAWSLALAAEVESALAGPEEVHWLTRLDAERDNIRDALEWASQAGKSELALNLATALWLVWTRQGHVMEGQRWLERALADSGASDAARAEALYRLGSLAIDLSEYARACSFYDASLALCRTANDERGVARALTGLGIVAADTGAFAEARQRYLEALVIHERLGDPGRRAWSLFNLGQVASAQGELDEAWSTHQAALNLRRALAGGDTAGIGYSLFALGQVARRLGQPAEALDFLEQALRTFQAVGDRQGTAYATLETGRTLLDQGVANTALPLLREATAAFREMADSQAVIDGLEAIALAAWREGDHTLAAHLLGATSLWREHMGLPIPPVERPALEELRRAIQGSEGHVVGQARPSLESLVKEAIAEAAVPAQSDLRQQHR